MGFEKKAQETCFLLADKLKIKLEMRLGFTILTSWNFRLEKTARTNLSIH